MFQVRGPMMVAGQYDEPTATMTTHSKDIDIISAFAADLYCPTPLFTAAAQFYYSAIAQGRGSEDLRSAQYWRNSPGSNARNEAGARSNALNRAPPLHISLEPRASRDGDHVIYAGLDLADPMPLRRAVSTSPAGTNS
jgi:hypothetical protein